MAVREPSWELELGVESREREVYWPQCLCVKDPFELKLTVWFQFFSFSFLLFVLVNNMYVAYINNILIIIN